MLMAQLFWEFFKTGLFAVGGGLATLPFLYEMSAKTGWFSTADIANLIAVSESTPGPIGVNMATYAGFHTMGIPGAAWATFSLVLPSIITIIIVYRVLEKFKQSQTVKNIFAGLRPASTALIAAAGLSVGKIALLHLDKIAPHVGLSEVWNWLCAEVSNLQNAGTCALTSNSGLLAVIDWKCCLLAIVIYYSLRRWKKHPVFYIACAAVAGIAFQL